MTFSLGSCTLFENTDTDLFFNPLSSEAHYKDGIFKFVDGKLGFFDLDSLEFQPLCDIEGCTHEDRSACNALGVYDDCSIFVDGDKLYRLETVCGESYEDRRIDLYSCDVSGANKTYICSVEGLGFARVAHVKSGTVYFTANEIEKGGKNIAYLCLVRLTTGKCIRLLKMDDGLDNSLISNGVYADTLYLTYRRNDDGYTKNHRYGLLTGKLSDSDYDVLHADSHSLVIRNSNGSIRVLSKKYDSSVYEGRITDTANKPPVVVNKHLIFSDDGVAYDLDSGRVMDTHQCSLIAYYHGRYIVRESDGSFNSLSFEEFFTKDPQ